MGKYSAIQLAEPNDRHNAQYLIHTNFDSLCKDLKGDLLMCTIHKR